MFVDIKTFIFYNWLTWFFFFVPFRRPVFVAHGLHDFLEQLADLSGRCRAKPGDCVVLPGLETGKEGEEKKAVFLPDRLCSQAGLQ